MKSEPSRHPDAVPPAWIRLLGAPTLLRSDGVVHVLSANDAAVLALIVFDPSLTRADIARLVWPKSNLDRSLNNLRQRVHKFKARAGVPVVDEGDGRGLCLLMPHDLDRPEALWATDAGALPGNPLERLTFSGREELAEIMDRLRAHWQTRRAKALRAAAAGHETSGRWEDALPFRERLHKEDPADETACRDLMRLYYRRGDRGAAAAAFECTKARLATQDLRPSRELLALRAQVTNADAEASEAHRLPPPALLRPPRLVARERESATIRNAQALGRLIVITGVAGIGKTRLSQEMSRGATEPIVVKLNWSDRGVAHSLLARVASQALARCAGVDAMTQVVKAELARLLPQLGSPSAAPFSPALFVQALVTLLDSAHVERVVVDDLQNADPESVVLLGALVAGSRDACSTWWLMTARTGELPAGVQAWLNGDDSGGPSSLDLGPLDEAAVGELLTQLDAPCMQKPAAVARLHRHSAGNPLFLLETLRELWTPDGLAWPGDDRLPLPVAVGELLTRRLARLGPQAYRLVQVAAIADGDLDAEMAAAMMDVSLVDLAPAWSEVERAQVMRGCAFTHDLLKEAAAQTVPDSVAEALHARVAATLRARGQRDAVLHAAGHWAAAKRWADAADAYREAAMHSRKLRQRNDEILFWTHVIECLRRAGANETDVMDAQAQSVASSLVVRGIDENLDLGNHLLANGTTPTHRSAGAACRLKALMLKGDFRRARDFGPQAVALATSAKDELRHFDASLFLAQAMGQTGEGTQALVLIDGLHAAMTKLDDVEAEYEWLSARAYVLRCVSRHQEQLRTSDRLVALAERMADPHELITTIGNRSTAQHTLGRAEAFYADAHRAHALHTKLGDTSSVRMGVVELNLGVAAAMLGSYGESTQWTQGGRRTLEATGASAFVLMAALNQMTWYVLIGQIASAKKLSVGDWSAAMPAHRMRRSVLLARLARWEGKAQPIDLLEQAAAAARELHHPASRHTVTTEASHWQSAHEACASLHDAVSELELAEELAMALAAKIVLAERLLELDRSAAHSLAIECWNASRERRPHDGLPPLWRACANVFDACGDRERLELVIGTFRTWLESIALPSLPPASKHSLVSRNPDVAALMRQAGRLDE